MNSIIKRNTIVPAKKSNGGTADDAEDIAENFCRFNDLETGGNECPIAINSRSGGTLSDYEDEEKDSGDLTPSEVSSIRAWLSKNS